MNGELQQAYATRVGMEIDVARFCGTITALGGHLRYLKELGINYLYFVKNPVPECGTAEEWKRLLQRLKRNDIATNQETLLQSGAHTRGRRRKAAAPQKEYLMRHESLMVELWSALAARDVRALQRRMATEASAPEDMVYLNFVRSEDPIRWILSAPVLRELQFDPVLHKLFLIHFYEGRFPKSFARGAFYEFRRDTLEARSCGTLASLCGLELAQAQQDRYQRELALKRILLLQAVILSMDGLPLIASGDELGVCNDYSQVTVTRGSVAQDGADTRLIHRQPMDWQATEQRRDLSTPAGQLFRGLQELVQLRVSEPDFTEIPGEVVDTWNAGVFGYRRGTQVLCLYNFTEQPQEVRWEPFLDFHSAGCLTDLISGRTVSICSNLLLGPYEYLWLMT